MTYLYEWYLYESENGHFRLKGKVCHHPKLPDGQDITTSPVVTFEIHENEVIAKTRNTNYQLQFINLSPQMSLMQLKEVFVVATKDDAVADRIWESITTYQTAQRLRSEGIVHRLGEGEVYIEIGTHFGYYFKEAMIKDRQGQVFKIKQPQVHIGMFQDSVIVSKPYTYEAHSEDYDFRYFPYKLGKIEFYETSVSEGEKCVREASFYLYNAGEEAMIYEVWGKTYRIESHEEQWVTADGEREEVVDDREKRDLYEAREINRNE